MLKFNLHSVFGILLWRLQLLFSILFSCPARLPGCFTVSPFPPGPPPATASGTVALAAAAAVCLSVWQLDFETEAFEAEKFETV